jgi:hypothetical protein
VLVLTILRVEWGVAPLNLILRAQQAKSITCIH